MIIAVGAVLVGILKFAGVLAEALLAFFAGENHLETLQKGVCFLLSVALDAVEPLLACMCIYEDQSKLTAAGRRRALSRQGEGIQHGDRIETWALRTCLLGKTVSTASVCGIV